MIKKVCIESPQIQEVLGLKPGTSLYIYILNYTQNITRAYSALILCVSYVFIVIGKYYHF